MPRDVDLDQLAGALRVSIGFLVRRLRQTQPHGALSLPQASALARLDRDGPATGGELAKREQISAQSMGATLGVLEDRGLIARSPDPSDARRVVMSVTDAGRRVMTHRRSEHAEKLAEALSAGFTQTELEQLEAAAPLLERLAQNL